MNQDSMGFNPATVRLECEASTLPSTLTSFNPATVRLESMKKMYCDNSILFQPRNGSIGICII